jgi:signal transduction histidine kinase
VLFLDQLDRRTATLLRLAGFVLISWTVFPGYPHASTVRLTAMWVSYGVSAVFWLSWMWRASLRGRIGFEPYVLALAGAVLLAANPNSAASAIAFVAAVVAGIRMPARQALVVPAISAVTLGVGSLITGESAVGAVAYSLGFAAAALAAGGRRQTILQTAQAQLLLAQTQRSQEEQVRAARLAESTRIAREIHDVLAHTLAGLTIQLEATAALIEQGSDPESVLARVRRAHQLARDGLDETRQAVGALRGERQPIGDLLERLINDYNAGGEGVAKLDITGDLSALPRAAADATVRLVQEAITNVRKHAPGADLTVIVRLGSDGLAVVVEDHRRNDNQAQQAPDPGLSSSGGGYGLAGITERATLLGGAAAAGATPGGWKVELTLPPESLASRV